MSSKKFISSKKSLTDKFPKSNSKAKRSEDMAKEEAIKIKQQIDLVFEGLGRFITYQAEPLLRGRPTNDPIMQKFTELQSQYEGSKMAYEQILEKARKGIATEQEDQALEKIVREIIPKMGQWQGELQKSLESIREVKPKPQYNVNPDTIVKLLKIPLSQAEDLFNQMQTVQDFNGALQILNYASTIMPLAKKGEIKDHKKRYYWVELQREKDEEGHLYWSLFFEHKNKRGETVNTFQLVTVSNHKDYFK